MRFNFYAFKAIYLHEMDRFRRTMMQSLFSPVLSTSLYFIVFGSVIGGYVENIDGISYGSYIVIMQAGFQYGTNTAIKNETGKDVLTHLKDVVEDEQDNKKLELKIKDIATNTIEKVKKKLLIN